MNRLYNLDYLRGLAAFGIMIYHHFIWTWGKYSADTFMGRLGIYGVAIFYVLSGLTLYYVYYEKMIPSKEDVMAFFKKRIFRILPLLWLVTIIAIILSWKAPDITNLLLNLSGLFGFIRWDKYFSPGVWSIGNELVFYVFFPFFILFIKRFKPLMIILSLAITGLYLYYAFVGLDPAQPLSEQWRDYVNPLNQVFLFLAGFLIGYFLHNVKSNNGVVLALLIAGLAVFTFYPAYGDSISLVTGSSRLVFTASCILICTCFYKLTFKFPPFIHKPLTLLGEASYSVYLLHPIVFNIAALVFTHLGYRGFTVPDIVRVPLSIIATLVISYFVYQYFEKYFMKLGRTRKGTDIAK